MLKPTPYTNLNQYLADWRGPIKAIAIADNAGLIGAENDLIFSFPSDMRRFADYTRNCSVLMGRRTAESLGGKLLPDRNNIVATRRRIYAEQEYLPKQTLWIIGGGEIYREALLFCETIYLTRVNTEVSNEIDPVYFPDLAAFEFQGHNQKWLDYCRRQKQYLELAEEVWTRR